MGTQHSFSKWVKSVQSWQNMDRDNPETFLNAAYCFKDGAFKRCPRFVTLSAFAYVGLLKMMVKLCTMEAWNEAAENRTVFGGFFSDVIRQGSSDLSSYFNPTGWCIDKAGGSWKSVKDVFKKDLKKTRTVNCEKHLWSVKIFTSSLVEISKSNFHFKELATKLMTANIPSMYEQAVKEINNYIESKSKRLLLRGFANFWNPSRHHFSRAFKNCNTPKLIYIESYNSSYVTGHTTILTFFRCSLPRCSSSCKLGKISFRK